MRNLDGQSVDQRIESAFEADVEMHTLADPATGRVVGSSLTITPKGSDHPTQKLLFDLAETRYLGERFGGALKAINRFESMERGDTE